MNVLLAAAPEPTTLFTITVQGAGGSPGQFMGRRHVMVPLHRLQSTHQRLLLAGDTILSVNRCQPMADPPPCPRPDPAPGGSKFPSPAPIPPAGETAVPRRVEPVPAPAHQDQITEGCVGEDMIVLLFSVTGVLILLTLQVVQHLAQQRRTDTQSRQRSDPAPAIGFWKRELANLRLGQLLRRASPS